MSQLRVTFVLPYADHSGGIQAAARHAMGLAERGHLVTVVSCPKPTPTMRDCIRSLIRQRAWPAAQRQGPSALDGTGLRWRILDRPRRVTDADVPDGDAVIATWWETVAGVAILSARKGVPVHFIQGHEVSEVIPGIPDQKATAVWGYRMGRVAVSQWLVDLAHRRYGCPSVQLVPNGVDLAKYGHPPRRMPIRPTVGFVCSPLRAKGADLAIAALDTVRARIQNLRVLAFGSTPRFGGISLPPWIEFTPTPSQDLIPSLYASCTVWVFPSREEGFGLPVLEAMAARTPVAATPAGAAAEILSCGGGVLVPGADSVALAAAVHSILTMSEAEWLSLSERASATASRFSWRSASLQFEQCLRGFQSGLYVSRADTHLRPRR